MLPAAASAGIAKPSTAGVKPAAGVAKAAERGTSHVRLAGIGLPAGGIDPGGGIAPEAGGLSAAPKHIAATMVPEELVAQKCAAEAAEEPTEKAAASAEAATISRPITGAASTVTRANARAVARRHHTWA